MASPDKLTRRKFLGLGAAAAGGLVLAACDWGAVLRGLTTDPTPTAIPVSTATETATPTATQTATATATATSKATERARSTATRTVVKSEIVAVNSPFVEVFRDGSVKEAKTIGQIQAPNPARAPAFPDVAQNGLPPQVEYVPSSANWDVWQTGKGELDVPQYHYKLFTARKIELDQLGINMESSGKKGCLAIVINYFGDTAAYKNTTVENGFTVAGRVWDMSTPDKMVTAAQALLDHQTGQMVNSPNGANCSTIDACKQVEWHVVVIGGGKPVVHWAGLYTK